MNIELRRRSDPLLGRVSLGMNDNAEERLTPRTPRRVVIFKPAKSAMTSGRARMNRWLLEFEPVGKSFIEPLMGWTGSSDPLAKMQLAFGSCEAAIAYAERHGLEYDVRQPAQPKRRQVPEGPANHDPKPLLAA